MRRIQEPDASLQTAGRHQPSRWELTNLRTQWAGIMTGLGRPWARSFAISQRFQHLGMLARGAVSSDPQQLFLPVPGLAFCPPTWSLWSQTVVGELCIEVWLR